MKQWRSAFLIGKYMGFLDKIFGKKEEADLVFTFRGLVVTFIQTI